MTSLQSSRDQWPTLGVLTYQASLTALKDHQGAALANPTSVSLQTPRTVQAQPQKPLRWEAHYLLESKFELSATPRGTGAKYPGTEQCFRLFLALSILTSFSLRPVRVERQASWSRQLKSASACTPAHVARCRSHSPLVASSVLRRVLAQPPTRARTARKTKMGVSRPTNRASLA